MILFTLKCGADHQFEAWFRDNAAYDRQEKRGLITCPDCGDTAIVKAPMAPRVKRAREAAQPQAVAMPAPGASPSAAEFRHLLQRMRRHVETNCDYVGDQFAAEARRIHNGEADARGIYGEASDSDAKDLADEGIEVARIPWVPSSDA